jgi:hypothetical protein
LRDESNRSKKNYHETSTTESRLQEWYKKTRARAIDSINSKLYYKPTTKQSIDSSTAGVVLEVNPTAGVPTIEGRDIEFVRPI